MSNAERQRQFRKRNPGYYQRLHARRTARTNESIAPVIAAWNTMFGAAMADWAVAPTSPAPVIQP